MFIPKLFIAGADFVSAGALDKAMNRSLMWSFVGPHLGDDGLGAWLGQYWKAMLDWLSQPREYSTPPGSPRTCQYLLCGGLTESEKT